MAKVLVHNQLWTIVAAPLVDGAHSCLMLHCCDHRDTEDWAVALKNPFFLPPTIHVVTAALPEDDDDGGNCPQVHYVPLDWLSALGSALCFSPGSSELL